MKDSQKHYTKQEKPDPRVCAVSFQLYETLGKDKSSLWLLKDYGCLELRGRK